MAACTSAGCQLSNHYVLATLMIPGHSFSRKTATLMSYCPSSAIMQGRTMVPCNTTVSRRSLEQGRILLVLVWPDFAYCTPSPCETRVARIPSSPTCSTACCCFLRGVDIENQNAGSRTGFCSTFSRKTTVLFCFVFLASLRVLHVCNQQIPSAVWQLFTDCAHDGMLLI
jgi:hypothetical protein